MDAAGTATTPRTATARMTRAIALRVAIGAAGRNRCRTGLDGEALGLAAPRGTRVPTRLSSAGVSVTAMSTAIATHAAATVPIRPRNPMPVTLSASSAMMTVDPAKTTALPEVPVARAMDSSTV